MPAIPRGEVTFVFTDIEGSTALFHELDELYLEVLAHHNALLRDVWDRHGGVEVKTEGDAFFVAFADASAALAAAADCQRVLASATWQHGRPVRVRIGMHTGTAVVVDEDYVGLDVHQAARVAGAAYGGQVLLTEATLAAAVLPSGLGVHDLGSHRLKDFPTERRLLQLTGPGLDAAFPPPRTTTARSHNLPRPPTPLVGRSRDNEAVQRAVVGDARLVTLTGSGGLGKTRLALESSWSVLGWFREGVWFVDLASLTEASAIPSAVAQQLALTERAGVTAFDLVVEKLSGGPSLLVLDNLEHLVEDDAITVVADLLAACADLTVLATSRERLRLRGEHEVVLDGMAMDEAGALFSARALAADADFAWSREEVAKVCQELEGIPLAIELAAARVRTHDVEQLLTGLSAALDLLTEGDRDLPTRQRTMRATVAWSWQLCTEQERAVLRSLSVFAGTVETDAVDAVHGEATGEYLAHLSDRSMVVLRDGRVGVLMPIRAFVTEQLDDQEREVKESAHGRYFAQLASTAAPHLVTGNQVAWLDRLDADALDLHLAVRRSPPAMAVAMAASLVRWWVRRSRWSVGREVLGEALGRPREGTEPDPLAEALAGAAELATLQGQLEQARTYLGDADALLPKARVAAHVANVRGFAARAGADLDAADDAFDKAQALAEQAGDQRLLTLVTTNKAELVHHRATVRLAAMPALDDQSRQWLEQARDGWREALAGAKVLGDDHLALRLTMNLSTVDMSLGDVDGARAALLAARELAAALGDHDSVCQADANLGLLAVQLEEDDEADLRLGMALRVAEEIGALATAGQVLHFWSLQLRDGGDLKDNLARARRSLAIAEQLGQADEADLRRSVLSQLLGMSAGKD